MNKELMARVKVGDVIVCPQQVPDEVITVVNINDGGDLRITNSSYPDDEDLLYTPCRHCRIKE